MKLLMQMIVLAAFLATMTTAQTRLKFNQGQQQQPKNNQLDKRGGDIRDLKSKGASHSHSSSRRSHSHSSSSRRSYDKSHGSLDSDVEGQVGVRMECDDKRFTMVCEWDANQKKKKYYKRSHYKSYDRNLAEEDGEQLDFEEDTEDVEKEPELTYITASNGRQLGVEMDYVSCVLGVGKKDSDSSDEDYEEYKERLKFPDDKWTIKIWEAEDKAIGERADYYKFTRKVEFEDIEDPNNSGDEITITGTLEIELFDNVDVDGKKGKLIFDDQDLKFSC